MHDHDRARRTPGDTEHVLQLFDTPDSLANVVSAFLNQGWQQGDQLVVIAKPAHWARTAERLERRGCPVPQATRDGRLIVLDAATTLARITQHGVVHRHLFAAHVASIVERLGSAAEGRVRIYGELVELLAAEGDFRGAEQLEQLWNELRERQPLVLLCGYSAAHFAATPSRSALRKICEAHSRVQTNTSDLLGNWLIGHQLNHPLV